MTGARPLGHVRVQAFGLDADDRRYYRHLHTEFGRHLAHFLFAAATVPELRWAVAILTADAEAHRYPRIDAELAVARHAERLRNKAATP